MIRIAGVDLPDEWKIDFALTRIKGIGWSLSRKILKEVGVENTKRIKDLTQAEISKISGEVEKYPVEGELLRQVKENIQRLRLIGSYRGMRHQRNLPVRGQRTRSNARTKRGARKTVGAFRKEMLAKMQQKKAKEE